MMTFIKKIILISAGISVLCSCVDFIPNTIVDLKETEETVNSDYNHIIQLGNMAYDYLPSGWNNYGAMLSAACDEADFAIPNSSIEYLQKGTWNAQNNPYDIWDREYKGIKYALTFLDLSENYEELILRDTSSTAGMTTYKNNCLDIKCMRAENKVLIGMMYFELLKRYGGVPIINSSIELTSKPSLTRNTIDEVFDYIIKLIDEAYPDLHDNWYKYIQNERGRIEKAGALALKSRVLLYAASPLYNTTNDVEKWKAVADPCLKIIDLNRFVLESDYFGAQLSTNGIRKNENIIYSSMHLSDSDSNAKSYMVELLNYPISLKGNVGHCPSENLVEAYEFKDGTPFSWDKVPAGTSPYANRDNRLYWSIYYNGNGSDTGHKFDCTDTGVDGPSVKGSSTTGYYMKKLVMYKINLSSPTTTIHAWPIIRYAEILMNYAEAMNEAYGPDTDPTGKGRTARWAINLVRKRAGQPNVVADTKDAMRVKIRQEDRVEFAFEEHRFWDCRRWGLETAREALGSPLNGIKISHNSDGSLKYEVFKVEDRVFKDHMIYYPIKQSEILLTNGMITQNPGW